MQTKFHSFIEVMTSTLIGYIVAILSQIVIFPLFDIEVAFSDNFIIAGWFTVISIIRGYVVRRWFNHLGSDLDDFLAHIFVRFRKVEPDEHEWVELGKATNLRVNGKEVVGEGTMFMKKGK